MNKLPPKPFSRLTFLALLPGFALLPWHALQAQEQAIGKVVKTVGEVEVLSSAGTRRPLARGSEIFAGDLLITGPEGQAQVRMADNALISFRPGTEFEFSEFVYDGEDGAGDSAIMLLIRGGFRTMSGTIGEGQGDEYRVLTEFANIGIRGTTHEAVIDPQGGALYTGVSDGGTTVSNMSGALDLGIGAAYDYSETQPGQAPRGLLTLPPAVVRYDFAELAAAGAPSAEEEDNAGDGGNAAPRAVAAAPSEAPVRNNPPAAATPAPAGNEPAPATTPAPAAVATRDPGPAAVATPTPAPSPAVAGETRIETPAPAASAPPPRDREGGLLDALAGALDSIRSRSRGGDNRNEGRGSDSGLVDALANVLRERGRDRPSSPGPASADKLDEARGKGRPAPVVAENTGDDTEAAINPAQNPGDLLAEVLGRIGGRHDGDKDKGKGKGRDEEEGEEDEERGRGRGIASRGGENPGNPLRRFLALEAAPAGLTLVEPPAAGAGAGVALLHEAPSAANGSIRPHGGFDVSWGFWDGEQPVITPQNASGALTPLPELAYWARVLPADMAELRALSARWRFDSASGQGHFIGGGSAGALSGLAMGFDVDLASGLISGGSFQAESGAGAQRWSLEFSGRVNGAAAVMDNFTNTLVQDQAGPRSAHIEGNIEGVFTGTGAEAGFVTGFSLDDGAGAHVQGIGLLEGAPQ